MKAVCVRCGFVKPGFAEVCPDCGHRPEGDGMLVAWILSDASLSEAELEAASKRIQGGESIRPSKKMLNKARRALGRQLSTDPGLAPRALFALLLGNLVFTPLIGWTCVVWWFSERPRAALQAGLVTFPSSVVLTLLWGWFAFGGAS